MTFYLLSEGLTCLSMFSGAYESLKVLSRANKGVDVAALTAVLEFWLVLGSLTIFEEYVEFLVSWIPLYYLFKCLLLGLVLMPNAKIPHVIYHGLIEPTVDHAQEHVRTHVLPLAEALVVRHGHWFHDKLLSRSLSLLDDHELQLLEHELLDKLDHVREEKRSRRCRSGVEIAGEAKE